MILDGRDRHARVDAAQRPQRIIARLGGTRLGTAARSIPPCRALDDGAPRHRRTHEGTRVDLATPFGSERADAALASDKVIEGSVRSL